MDNVKCIAVWQDTQVGPGKAWIVSLDVLTPGNAENTSDTLRVFKEDEGVRAESHAREEARARNLPIYTYSNTGDPVPLAAPG